MTAVRTEQTIGRVADEERFGREAGVRCDATEGPEWGRQRNGRLVLGQSNSRRCELKLTGQKSSA